MINMRPLYQSITSANAIASMVLSILIVCISIIPIRAHAKQIECTIKSHLVGPTDIQFDTDKKTVEIAFPGPVGILHGQITRISKSANGTDAYNFVFSDLPKKWVGGDDEWEFLLHRNSGAFVIYGVGYVFVNGKPYLTSIHPMHTAYCINS